MHSFLSTFCSSSLDNSLSSECSSAFAIELIMLRLKFHLLLGASLCSEALPRSSAPKLCSEFSNLLSSGDLHSSLVAFYTSQISFRRKRKTRTAFTTQQICELEKQFALQKYLTPADRDQLAARLGLTNSQVRREHFSHVEPGKPHLMFSSAGNHVVPKPPGEDETRNRGTEERPSRGETNHEMPRRSGSLGDRRGHDFGRRRRRGIGRRRGNLVPLLAPRLTREPRGSDFCRKYSPDLSFRCAPKPEACHPLCGGTIRSEFAGSFTSGQMAAITGPPTCTRLSCSAFGPRPSKIEFRIGPCSQPARSVCRR